MLIDENKSFQCSLLLNEHLEANWKESPYNWSPSHQLACASAAKLANILYIPSNFILTCMISTGKVQMVML